MKKVSLITAFCVICLQSVHAQLFNEIFRQKATQRKYLSQQILQLQLHLDALKTGYNIAKDGIRFIRKLSDGEFSLHDLFFSNLKIVPAAIRGSATAAASGFNLVHAYSALNSLRLHAGSTNFLLPTEATQLQEWISFRLQRTGKMTDELMALLSSGRLQLSHDERLQRLEAHYAASAAFLSEIRQVSKSGNLLTLQRQRADAELKILQRLNND